MSMKSFTVLLAVPDEIADGATCHENTYISMVEEHTIEDAVVRTQLNAAIAYEYDGNGEDFAVLGIFYGYHRNLVWEWDENRNIH